MEQPSLSRDSYVVLLLASHLGSGPEDTDSDSGLGPAGWQDFASNIDDSSLDSPGDLLRTDSEEWPDSIWLDKATREWVEQRLSRSTKLAMELEDLNNRGIWVTTQFEESYPARLHENLGRKAPPFLYVAGEAAQLQTRAVGFVGSRDADDNDKAFTRALVEKVIADGFGVVSGGAKGIDETSEEVGTKHGGPVVEFPTEGLRTCLKENRVRDAVMNGVLTLASQYHPEASWNVGAAMGRNKLIHGFAEYTMVIRSGNETGGTWEGSTENLEHGWSPLLVCQHDDTPEGNRALLSRGGVPIDPTDIPEDDAFEDWLQGRLSESRVDREQRSGGRNGSAESTTAEHDRGESRESENGDRQSSLDQF